MVIELNSLRIRAGTVPAFILQHLMDRVHPAKAKARVRLFDPEHAALAPIRQEAPRVAVAQPLRAACQRPLHCRAPAGMKHLVKIGADAQVRVLRHQPE